MKKKYLMCITAFMLAFSCIASCAKKNPTSETDSDKTAEITDVAEHLVSGDKTLHQVSVTDVGRTFVGNASQGYEIILGTDSATAYSAADFLSKQVGRCTGSYLKYYVDADQNLQTDGESSKAISWSKTSKFIVISHDKLEKQSGVSWKTDVDLGYSGYMIKTVGDSVFIKVNSEYAYQTSAICFCKQVLGYEWYSEDTIVYTKDGSTLPNMNIVEKPDFDFVDRSGYISTAGQFGSGQTCNQIFAYADGTNFVHNSFVYLPPTKYNQSEAEDYHPKWYATKSGQSSNSQPDQLCYTSHGDTAEYDAMLNAAFTSVMNCIYEYPKASTVTFTHEDKYGMCECETCKAMKKAFGSITASFMMFVNDLDDLIQAQLTEDAQKNGTDKREITVLFFAYSIAIEPPVSGTCKDNYAVPETETVVAADGKKYNVVNDDGKQYILPYHKTYENGLKCNEHVGVFYAPINAQFTESFYHSSNDSFRIMLEKWGLLTNRIYVWLYDTNFSHFVVPFNSYDSIAETLRLLKDNNCMYIFNQAQGIGFVGTNSVISGFGSLKTYLNMTLPSNVNQNAGQLTDKFFDNYFREASTPMREYYESLVAYIQQLEEKYPSVFNDGGALYTDTEDSTYWKLISLQNWLDLCDDAYVAIEKYKAQSPELYETLVKHIKIETLFPRFMICEYYSGYYTNTEISDMRQAFYDDCQELNYQLYSEGVNLSEKFSEWGL